ncbi:amino acid ABC transporter substrate-binding protein [Sagittula sp. NFXS13]|uniref:General L-amino acid transport system substrate-binding protein n=1 Tax=Sagittula marina TaxID=943940 RepID=A0A7W6DNI4_9RHOB|nr:amino acid ABC transporter substrate-binding protein [Sagittula marina]MBB3986376.1 general L-amino acid transport system substrate-binding protein [Sagittula marina]
MYRTFCAGALMLAATTAMGGTLEDVKARGSLNCGVNTGLVGFASKDSNDNWHGFDVGLCRAVAAAILGDPSAVTFHETTAASRYRALNAGEIDVLVRNTTWSFSSDVDLKVDFAGINYYDGQAFMVPKALGLSSARELDGRKICVQAETTSAQNVDEYFNRYEMTYEAVPVDGTAEAQTLYLEGVCDVYSSDASQLAAIRATFAAPSDHVLLEDIISKEPLGPVVRHGDDDWTDLVRWVLNALIAAEELGVTSANIDELRAKGTSTPEINRLLGLDGLIGEMMRLDPEWAVRAIKAGGNYGELFARHIGTNTPIGLSRGLNLQWTEGGLLYSPPFR